MTGTQELSRRRAESEELRHVQVGVLSRQYDVEFEQERYFRNPYYHVHGSKTVKLNEITKCSECVREVLGMVSEV